MHIPAHTHVIHWKQVGEFEEAEQMYRRAMGTARDAAEHMVTPCHNFGILKVEMGQTERAGELLKKALLVDPFHIPSCLTYGRLLLETKVPLSPSSCVRLLAHTHARAHARTHTRAHTHTHTHTHTYTHNIYIRRTHARTHTRAHTHMHMHNLDA